MQFLRFIRSSLLIFLLTFSSLLRAQDVKSFSRQMNEIKRSGDYVYAEATAPTQAEAMKACNELLKVEISKYLAAECGGDKVINSLSGYNCQYLTQPRGEILRIFGYVAKNELRQLQTPSEKPKEQDMLPVVTQQEMTPSQKISVSGSLKSEGLSLAQWQLDMLERIASSQNILEARKVLNRYKTQNRIKRLGDQTVTNPRVQNSHYLIFDETGAPIALLAPSLDSQHYDMISGNTERLEDYIGLRYLWFQISK